MKEIQIACVPENWDKSTITALGMYRNGRRALPVTIIATELEEPWLSVWHGLVATLKGVAPGEWAATYISAVLCEMPIEETEGDTQSVVQLTIYRKWDDMTTAEPIILHMDDANAVAFFNHLTQDDNG